MAGKDGPSVNERHRKASDPRPVGNEDPRGEGSKSQISIATLRRVWLPNRGRRNSWQFLHIVARRSGKTSELKSRGNPEELVGPRHNLSFPACGYQERRHPAQVLQPV